MKRPLQWVLVLTLCASLIIVNSLTNPRLVAEQNYERADRKLADIDYSGFISIDCGSNMDYVDEETGFRYRTDKDFVETGMNQMVSPSVDLNYPLFGKQLSTLRSFPEGKRNCYTLKPKHGKNNSYIIRAFFAYGNYDFKNQNSSFDLYLGVYHWYTIKDTADYDFEYTEIIHTPSTDTIQVCLVKTGPTIPYINALELRLLNSSIYHSQMTMSSSTPQPLLYLEERTDVNNAPTRRLNSSWCYSGHQERLPDL